MEIEKCCSFHCNSLPTQKIVCNKWTSACGGIHKYRDLSTFAVSPFDEASTEALQPFETQCGHLKGALTRAAEIIFV